MRSLSREEARSLLGLGAEVDFDDDALWSGPLSECLVTSAITFWEAELLFTGIAVAVHADGRFVGALAEESLPSAVALFAKAGAKSRIPVVIERRNDGCVAHARR